MFMHRAKWYLFKDSVFAKYEPVLSTHTVYIVFEILLKRMYVYYVNICIFNHNNSAVVMRYFETVSKRITL